MAQFIQGLGKLFHRFRLGLVVNELPVTPAFNQIGISQNLQMVRNCPRRNIFHLHQFAAKALAFLRDFLVDPQASRISEGLRDFGQPDRIHKPIDSKR